MIDKRLLIASFLGHMIILIILSIPHNTKAAIAPEIQTRIERL